MTKKRFISGYCISDGIVILDVSTNTIKEPRNLDVTVSTTEMNKYLNYSQHLGKIYERMVYHLSF